MPAEPGIKRAVSFFDGQNLYRHAKNAFGYHHLYGPGVLRFLPRPQRLQTPALIRATGLAASSPLPRGLLVNGHDVNVAFKCTYNDGGDRGFVGFGGTCSNGNILRNVKTNPRRWCSHPENACRRFCDNEFRGRRPRHPCYESQIIDRWRIGPGTHLAEDGVGEPIPMKHARAGKVALLTTRHPDHDTESERIVFGVYKIIEVSEDENGEIWLDGSVESAIQLSETAAFALPYWRFTNIPRGGRPRTRASFGTCRTRRSPTSFMRCIRTSGAPGTGPCSKRCWNAAGTLLPSPLRRKRTARPRSPR